MKKTKKNINFNKKYYNRYVESIYNTVKNIYKNISKSFFNNKTCLNIYSNEGIETIILSLATDADMIISIEENEKLIYKSIKNLKLIKNYMNFNYKDRSNEELLPLDSSIIKENKNNLVELPLIEDDDLLEDLKKECRRKDTNDAENEEEKSVISYKNEKNNRKLKGNNDCLTYHNYPNPSNSLIYLIEIVDYKNKSNSNRMILDNIEFLNKNLSDIDNHNPLYQYDLITCFDNFHKFNSLNIDDFIKKCILLLKSNGFLLLELDSRVDYLNNCHVNRNKKNIKILKDYIQFNYCEFIQLTNEIYISSNSIKGYDKPVLIYQKY